MFVSKLVSTKFLLVALISTLLFVSQNPSVARAEKLTLGSGFDIMFYERERGNSVFGNTVSLDYHIILPNNWSKNNNVLFVTLPSLSRMPNDLSTLIHERYEIQHSNPKALATTYIDDRVVSLLRSHIDETRIQGRVTSKPTISQVTMDRSFEDENDLVQSLTFGYDEDCKNFIEEKLRGGTYSLIVAPTVCTLKLNSEYEGEWNIQGNLEHLGYLNAYNLLTLAVMERSKQKQKWKTEAADYPTRYFWNVFMNYGSADQIKVCVVGASDDLTWEVEAFGYFKQVVNIEWFESIENLWDAISVEKQSYCSHALLIAETRTLLAENKFDFDELFYEFGSTGNSVSDPNYSSVGALFSYCCFNYPKYELFAKLDYNMEAFKFILSQEKVTNVDELRSWLKSVRPEGSELRQPEDFAEFVKIYKIKKMKNVTFSEATALSKPISLVNMKHSEEKRLFKASKTCGEYEDKRYNADFGPFNAGLSFSYYHVESASGFVRSYPLAKCLNNSSFVEIELCSGIDFKKELSNVNRSIDKITFQLDNLFFRFDIEQGKTFVDAEVHCIPKASFNCNVFPTNPFVETYGLCQ